MVCSLYLRVPRYKLYILKSGDILLHCPLQSGFLLYMQLVTLPSIKFPWKLSTPQCNTFFTFTIYTYLFHQSPLQYAGRESNSSHKLWILFLEFNKSKILNLLIRVDSNYLFPLVNYFPTILLTVFISVIINRTYHCDYGWIRTIIAQD